MAVVETPGARIHYEVTGAGRPIIFGHSFLCSGAMWAPQVPALAAGYRVINVDTRGHGASGPAGEGVTLGDLLGDHLAVLDALGVGRAVWAGLSLGGMIAIRAALEVPERVAGLILLDTDGAAELLRTRAMHAALALIARTLGLRPVVPRVAALMFGPTTLRTNPALVTDWSRRFAGVHVPSALRVLRVIDSRKDVLPLLSNVKVPALVLVGAEDRSLPPACSRRLAAALPGARLVEIPAAGHLSNLEQPRLVTGSMLDFLDGLAAPAPGRAITAAEVHYTWNTS